MEGIKVIRLLALFVFSLAVERDVFVYGSLHLEVYPRSVEVGRTRSLHVHCSYVPETGQGMVTLVSLVVSGLREHVTDVEKSESPFTVTNTNGLQDIASISVFSSQVRVAPSNWNVIALGYIQPREKSYLSFVIDEPNFDAPDTYKCTAHGIRKNSQPMVLSDNAQVLITRSSLNKESRQKLENLESVVEEAVGEILTINKRQSEQYRNFSDDITDLSSTQLSHDFKIGALESELEAYENISNHLISVLSEMEKLRVEDHSEVQSELATLKIQNENATAQIVALETQVKQYQNTSMAMSSRLSSLERLSVTADEMSKNKNSTPIFRNGLNETNQSFRDVMFPGNLTAAETEAELRRWKVALLYIEQFYFASKRYDDSIYLLPKNMNGKSLEESDLWCKRFGGYLAEINDQGEYNFIVSFIKDLPGFQTVYTGAEYRSTPRPGRMRNKDWIYRSSKKPVSFTAWAEGEPNNLVAELCLTLEQSMSWKMNDNICTASSRGTFLCEVAYDGLNFLRSLK
ncbi:unnamed protein product [Lymnaea stagnalis]|uniref:C-type lectin domain-containing protein n=1 Tax=Lymnaea stagnalis TaxID=6523 RepID=A0AAV2H7N5_LYMST